jgi:hypothetical protein
MDQKLLDALSNMSAALEQIAEALKDKKGSKSATTEALQGGDFVKQIKEIDVGVKQLQADTKKILKNQETIIALSKKSSNDKKTPFEEAGGNKKKENEMKKGIGTILLIAVAVLAIGMAFKLIGGINFLSVVGLSLAILILSYAFEKIGRLNMSLKQAAITSAAMVLMALAVTISSWILKLLKPISFAQAITMILIGVGFSLLSPAIHKIILAFKGMSWMQIAKAAVGLVMVLPAIALGMTVSSWFLRMITPISFAQALTLILIGVGFMFLAPAINKIIKAFKGMSWGELIKATIGLVLVLPAIALGMTISSWIMKKITPISFAQGITAILIAAVFTVISFGLKKMLKAFGGSGIMALGKAILFLPLVLPAIALGIMLSSYVLGKTQPVGLKEAWSAIMIALIFTVISFGLKKIINAMEAVDNPAKMLLIPLLLPAVAVAIWLSSMALSKVQMMSFGQFLVSLGISILFIVFAVALKIMAPVIRKLSLKDVLLIPLLMTTMSIAVWASSHILKKTADISFMLMLKILVFSVVFAIAVIVLAAVSWVIAKYFGVKNVLKGSVAIVALAGVVMMSSWLISKGKYDKYPNWKWSLMAGLSIAAFGVIAWVLMKIGGISTYIKGGIAILAVAATVMAASHIIAVGNYGKYPKLSWAIGVAASLAAFGVGAALLGPLVFGPQALIFLAGLGAVLGVAGTIMAASHILAQGKYTKYPSIGWSMSVGMSLAAFTTGMVLLGGMIVASFGLGAVALAAGAEAVLSVTQTIVDASHILAKGNWKKGPTVAWASGVAIALGAFSPIYSMLMNNGVMKLFGGGGVGPEDFANAIITVTNGIITAAGEFASPRNKGVWKKGPTKEWATGVGIALGAFAPVYGMLMNNAAMKSFTGKGGVGPEDFAKAILTVTRGIITAAKEFAKNTAPFKEGMYPSKQWGEGVGAALNAFAPVFKALSEDTGWFTSGDDVINNMVNGVLRMASAIVGVGRMMSDPSIKWDMYPSKDWATNIKNVIISYTQVAQKIQDLEVDWMTLSNMDSMVRRVTTTARMFGMNEKYFNAKINPNFMKSISSNLFYYMAVAKKLQDKRGGISGMIKGALMGDPIINMAKGMIELAKAYDKLAASLTKMGKAMNNFNDKKIAQLERLSRIQPPKGVGLLGGIGNAIGSVISSAANMFSKAPTVQPPTQSKRETPKSFWPKGKYGDIAKQNDMIIDLLQQLNEKLSMGSNIDAASIKYLSEKKSAKM